MMNEPRSRIVRFATQGKVKYGVLEDNLIRALRGSPLAQFRGPDNSFRLDGSEYELGQVRLLAPCLPSKLVCLGWNYARHAQEANFPIPSTPVIFLKPSTAVIGSDENIILPRSWKQVDYEGELGVVIGKKAKDVPKESAKGYVLGYICVNDVSERTAQKEDKQWTRGKGFDTFAPIGPWIQMGIEPDDLKLETYLNGELRQSARTSELIFGVAELVSFISDIMTLLPGDVIATGTPGGTGSIKPGDVVEVTIENIGRLRNSVVSQQ